MNKIFILLAIITLNLFSQEYSVYEKSNFIELHFMNIKVNDSINLPNYILDSNKENLKFSIVFQDDKDLKVYLNDKIIDFKFEYDQNFRGIDLYKLEIPFNQIKNNSKLKISFNEVELSTNKQIESNLFPLVINKQHLNYIIENKVRIKESKLSFQNDNWFDRSKKYVKFKTNEDRVYKLNTSDLVHSLGNIQVNKLGVKVYGNDYPYFYVNSQDNILDENDEVYLLGKIQKGDTTYYEHYNSYVSFYFYESENEVTYLNVIENSNLNQIEFVDRNLHIEKELVYSNGYDYRIVDTDKNYYEGWYFSIIEGNNLTRNRFENILTLYPNVINSINMRYVTFIEGFPDIFNIYNLEFYQNNKKLDSILFTGFRKADYNYSSNEIILGNNELEIYSENYINNKNQEEHGRLGVDYYDVEGSFYPVANNNFIDFSLNSNEGSYVEVSNLRNSTIASIDTINNTIELIKGQEKAFIAGQINNEKSYASISLNESAISGEKNYFLIYKNDENILSINTNNVQEVNHILNNNPEYFLFLNLNNIDNTIQNNLSKYGFTTFSNSSYYFYSKDVLKSNQLNMTSKFYEVFEFNSDYFVGNVSLNSGLGVYIVNGLEDNFLEGKEIQFNNYESSENQADIIYITSRELENSVNQYLEYRQSTHPDLKFKIAYVEDIYDEFNFGIQGPHSLKKFLKQAYYNWQAPQFTYVYMIGETSWDYDIKSTNSIVKPLVPTFGLPVSDIWYTDIDTSNTTREEFYISRLTANNNEELLTYLEKLKEFEKIKSAPWHKKNLMIIGGFPNERESFQIYSDNAFKNVYNSDLAVDTTYIISLPQDGFEISRGEDIRREINNGILWTNFIGHGSTTVFDVGGWDENQLNNFGRTGILSTLSCNTNAFGESHIYKSKNESYILYPKNGFIFTYGGTTLGIPGIQNLFLVDMMKAIADRNLKVRNVCEIKKIGTSQLQFGFDIHYLTFGTLGDPLIDIPLSKTYDFYFLESETKIINESSFITVDDSIVELSTNIYNNGYCSDSTIIIKIEHLVNDYTEILYDTLTSICNVEEYKFKVNTNSITGLHRVIITIDSENNYLEDYENNNQTEISFNVFNRSLIPIDPKNNWNVKNDSPRFRFYDPNYFEGKEYKFSIYSESNTIVNSSKDEISVKDNAYITWAPNVELNINSKFSLEYEFIDSDPNNIGKQILEFSTSPISDNLTSFNYNLKDFTLENIDLNSDNELLISNIFEDFEVITKPRYYTENSDNHFYLKIAGKEFINSKRTTLGVYVIKIDRNNFDLKDVEFFYTFTAREEGDNFLNYIQDSLNPKDINLITFILGGFNVFMTTCKEGEYCHLDNLKSIFKEKFGSKLIDSINTTEDGFSLIYTENENTVYLNEVYESISNSFTEVILQGEIQKPIYDGSVEFEIPKDVSRLESLEIQGFSDNSTINLSSYNNNGELSQSYSNIDIMNENKFELIPEEFKFRIDISRYSLNDNPHISNIILNYKPFPELGLKNKTIIYDSMMRADDFRLEYELSNYSLRSDLDSTFLRLRNNSQLIDNIKIEKLLFDDDTLISKDIVTDNLTTSNQYTARINLLNSSKELINNDNSVNYILNIFEDRESPILKAFANNSELFDQAYVSETSTFTIYLYDNSNLEINDKSKFTRVRLNGWVEDSDIKFSNTFSENADPSLRATIQFTSNNLELGEFNTNLLEITAQDATGNETSIEYYLNITRKNKLDSLINYPNPFIDEFKLSFNYIGSIEPASAVISIFDINGKEVYNDKIENVKIGNNEYSIRLDSVKGNSVSSGNYVIVIQLQNNLDRKSAIIQKSK